VLATEVLLNFPMVQLKHNPSRYCGYRTPFHDEICSERLFAEKLSEPNCSVTPCQLMPIARQLKVFGVEKLDLLALDRHAVPWIFEFKRDIAPYEAIAQLQTYGSYISGFGLSELEHVYANGDRRRRNLRRDFTKFFGQELPEATTHQVNLVLAAFDFSLPCRRTIQFLEHSANLVIGQLKIDCVWDGQNQPLAEYRFIKLPRKTEAPNLSLLRSGPSSYYLLSLKMGDEMPIHWHDYIYNELLPIPSSWDTDIHPISEGQGVFVHLHNIYPPEAADDWESPDHGVVAYGVVTEAPFDLWSRPNEFRLPANTIDKLQNLPRPFRVMRVRWVQARFEDMPAGTPLRYQYDPDAVMVLTDISNNQREWKVLLEMDPDECPF
jgi:hypothetical protein